MSLISGNSLKTVFLDSRQVKEVRRQVEYVGSDSLKKELDDFIENNDGGEYLINIFSDSCFLEFRELSENFHIFDLVF